MDAGTALLLALAVIMPIITVMLVLTMGGGHYEDESKSPYDPYCSSMWGRER